MYRNGKTISIKSGINGLSNAQFFNILLLAIFELIGGIITNKYLYKNVMDISWLYVVTIIILLVLIFTKTKPMSYIYIAYLSFLFLPIVFYIFKPSVTYTQAQNKIKAVQSKEKMEVLSEKAAPGKSTLSVTGKNLIDKAYLVYVKKGDKLITYIINPVDGSYEEHEVKDLKK